MADMNITCTYIYIYFYTHIYVIYHHVVEPFAGFGESFQILVVDQMLRHHEALPFSQGEGRSFHMKRLCKSGVKS